jgi:ATP-dependent DNA helicase RecQ
MRLVQGVGDVKLRDFGPRFLHLIAEHSEARGLARDVNHPARQPDEPPQPTPRQREMSGLFRKGLSIEEVMSQAGLARSTVMEYLAGYVRSEKPASIRQWVDETTYHRVAEAARRVGTERLKPIFLALGEQVEYDLIRLVVAHLLGADQEGR